jgi:hypothetical protein
MHMTVDRRIPFYRFYRQCTGISTKIGILPRPRLHVTRPKNLLFIFCAKIPLENGIVKMHLGKCVGPRSAF